MYLCDLNEKWVTFIRCIKSLEVKYLILLGKKITQWMKTKLWSTMCYLQFSIRFCLWHSDSKIHMEKCRFDLLTSRKKLTRYGSCFSFAHTIQRNWISSFSVGVARTSPHSLINFCHTQKNTQLRQEGSYCFT